MRLKQVEISCFRNILNAELVPAEHTTVLCGANGQGKTNFLEAVYLLSTLRPLRATQLRELIRHGNPQAKVGGLFELNGAQRAIAVDIREKGRTTYVDSKPVKNLSEYFGGVAVVAFTPDDLATIKGGPEGRRKLLDRAVFNRFPSHLETARDYQRALKQRNRLLKENRSFSLLDAYNETLATIGAAVWFRRVRLLQELAPLAIESLEAIAPGDGGVTLLYKATSLVSEVLYDEKKAAEALLTLLREKTPRDKERGFTSVGPHTDDLEIFLGNHLARTYASQGQQRAIMLAWKIGEIENIRRNRGYPPLLLLDDVSSELDPARNSFLMNYLRQSQLQVFLTTTDDRHIRPATEPNARFFQVYQGTLKLLS